MQNTDYHHDLASIEHTVSVDSRLSHLLPGPSRLQLNTETRILSLICTETAHILALQKFTRNEWTIFMSLLECYPCYAPYEMLLASLTLLSIDASRQRLQQAQLSGTQARELKPVQRALYGIRAKLSRVTPDLKVSLVRDAGYALTISPTM